MQALQATQFTRGMTAMGAAVIFFFKGFIRKMLDIKMGFAAGVMIAASFWSQLNPAIDMAREEGTIASWILRHPAFTGWIFHHGQRQNITPSSHKISPTRCRRHQDKLVWQPLIGQCHNPA